MKAVSIEELVMQKLLTFDLYNEDGDKIMSAGEFLTPGKLLQLHHIQTLYREETPDEIKSDSGDDKNIFNKIPEKSELEDLVNLDGYTSNRIDKKSQKDITNLFSSALNERVKGDTDKLTNLCLEARDRIVEQVFPIINDIVYKSELKVYGDYNYAHGINVSLLSTVLASKLGYDETMIRDIALGAMLCDIGKTRIPPELFNKIVPSNKETKIMQMHTILGYKILKDEMKLPEHVAKIALEHHEHNDGSGYPYGISGEFISPASQIIIVCDVYDDLTSRKGPVAVKNSKEAVKVLMEIGSRWFAPNVLYKFVYMSNFNDLTPT